MAHTHLFGDLQRHFAAVGNDDTRGSRTAATNDTRASGRFSRRRFIQALGTAGLAAGFAPLASAAGSPSIVVIGAGLAGLTCAYRLRQAGYEAAIFEGSDRVGGRCASLRGYFEGGQVVERGGELIDQSHTAIRHLAQELGFKLDNLLQAESPGTEPGYFFDGGLYSYAEATADIKKIWQKLHRDLSDAGYPTLYSQFTSRGWELDHLSVIDWINESVPGGLNSRLGQLLDIAYNIEYGAESQDQSALNLIYLLGFSGQGRLRIFGPSNEKYHVRGGNDQIPARLAELLAGQIRFGNRLAAVRRRPDGRYALTLEIESAAREVSADHVVLALPFSSLRSSVDLVQSGFRPLKLTAINQLGMGNNAKLQLQFADRLWRQLGLNGDSYADTGYQSTWEVTRAQPGRPGILVDYSGGNVALSMNQGTVESRAELFLQQIEPLLPGLSAQWNGKASLEYWPGNPWTRGSYSYWRVGQYTAFAGVEREPEGNCRFAGEHTSVDSQGYLNGAVESGERAAQEILEALR